ncbi:endochitinase 2-like [Haliotis rubra]|uniref:endochitinase 2-like n=1 Tax=Haliotis rubra TaxID=36100 RepID=UPI001EE5C3EC|nr:endochitinase 2-like [Haliotis rubra]XP_046577121.1 endochitinase 2-like [Haliotis rubra]XP_046577126.1 endochitinase 2-like [Haliotis rubra]
MLKDIMSSWFLFAMTMVLAVDTASHGHTTGLQNETYVTTPQGSLPTTQEPVTSPQGNRSTTQEPVTSPQGNRSTTQEPGTSPQGNRSNTQEPVTTPQESWSTTQEPVTSPRGNWPTTQEPVTPPQESWSTTRETVTTPQESRSATRETMTTPLESRSATQEPVDQGGEILTAVLDTEGQCNAMCVYVKPCSTYCWQTQTGVCQLKATGRGSGCRPGQEWVYGTLDTVRIGADHPCGGRPCQTMEMCIRVTSVSLCLPLGSSNVDTTTTEEPKSRTPSSISTDKPTTPRSVDETKSYRTDEPETASDVDTTTKRTTTPTSDDETTTRRSGTTTTNLYETTTALSWTATTTLPHTTMKETEIKG